MFAKVFQVGLSQTDKIKHGHVLTASRNAAVCCLETVLSEPFKISWFFGSQRELHYLIGEYDKPHFVIKVCQSTLSKAKKATYIVLVYTCLIMFILLMNMTNLGMVYYGYY